MWIAKVENKTLGPYNQYRDAKDGLCEWLGQEIKQSGPKLWAEYLKDPERMVSLIERLVEDGILGDTAKEALIEEYPESYPESYAENSREHVRLGLGHLISSLCLGDQFELYRDCIDSDCIQEAEADKPRTPKRGGRASGR